MIWFFLAGYIAGVVGVLMLIRWVIYRHQQAVAIQRREEAIERLRNVKTRNGGEKE